MCKIRLKSYFFIVSSTLLLLYFLESYFYNKGETLSIILWWTPFMTQLERKISCGDGHNCILTTNRDYRNHSRLAAYLFYGSQLAIDDLPLPKSDVPWAIYHEESPKNLAFFLHRSGQNLFEITSTFSRNSHLPIPLQFLGSIYSLTDLSYYVSLDDKNQLDIAPVLYIQSDCETPIERDIYVKELMKYIKVDSYGSCLNNKELPHELKIGTFNDVYESKFMKFVAQYKFTIAIENSVCSDYITEKLWRPLIVGSIPIYLGSPTITDWLPNNKSAILIKDFPTIKDVARYINDLNNNDERYLSYLRHKINKTITNELLIETLKAHDNTDHMITAFECFVCKSARNKDYLIVNRNRSVYECFRPVSKSKDGNFWMQHWDMGKCEAKTLHYFVNVLKLSNFTKDMFDKRCNQYFDDDNCV